jgi:Holliday junction DNA helicase RuvA
LITLLTGTVADCGEGTVTLNVGGVGFDVEVPASTQANMPRIGEEATLFTRLYLRPEEIRLFGFSTREERRLFEILISIQKVGVRTALDVLSTLSLEDFHAAILAGNLKALTQVRGIGRKLAERILFELKEKISLLPLPEGKTRLATTEFPSEKRYIDAVDALIGLGCRPVVAQKAIGIAYKNLGPDAPLEDLIREGLRNRTA